MGLRFLKEPKLEHPYLLCGWPGIGSVGFMAVDYLRRAIVAKEFAEIEPWDFFEPQKVIIKNGLLRYLEFPNNKFYYKRLKDRDLIIFIAESQTSTGTGLYAIGSTAYRLAGLVLDVAEKFGCRRIYTSGAAVTQTHHSIKPRVWAVPNDKRLIQEVSDYENTVLMSEAEGRSGKGAISGLNGLLLGVAKKRGIEAICLMGEVPYYLQSSIWPYPAASLSVLETITNILRIKTDLEPLQEMLKKINESIDGFFNSLYRAEAIPPEVRTNIQESIERMRYARQSPRPITEEDQKRIMEHIDEFFKERGGDERHTSS